MSTAIEAPATHWKQTVLWLREEHRMSIGLGDVIRGELKYDRLEDNPREYNISLSWRIDSHPEKNFSQVFGLRA